MRIPLGWLIVVPVIRSSFVYDSIQWSSQIDDLIEAEAYGWVVPTGGTYGFLKPMVWFSTDLGSGKLSIRPQSYLAFQSFLRFSVDEQNQMAMRVLKPSTALSPIGGWVIVDEADFWVVKASLALNDRPLSGGLETISIDLSKEDIGLAPSMFDVFRELFPADSVDIVGTRLVVACAELNSLTGTGLNVMIGDVAIPVREVAELDSELSELKKAGSCPVNMVFDVSSPVVGRAILDRYDLVFDGFQGRVLVIPKTSLRPNAPLKKFRLDSDFSSSSGSVSWRWRRSLGPVTRADFIITGINRRGTIDVLCLRRGCAVALLPGQAVDWMGVPVIHVERDMLTVSDQKGWVSCDLSVVERIGTVTIVFSKRGYRMKRDLDSYVEGERIGFSPVVGPKQRGEFLVVNWPPVQGDQIPIRSLMQEDLVVYLPEYARFHGKPQFEIRADKRLVISAESGEMECDRMIQITTTLEGLSSWDFNTQLCQYRQVDLGQPGYAFELVPRSQSTADEITLRHSGGNFDFVVNDDLSLSGWAPTGFLWNPKIRWIAEPVLTFDPNTKRVTITPSGESGWEYSHVWMPQQDGTATLVFKALPILLQVPNKIVLSDRVWEFIPAKSGSTSAVIHISKSRWLRRNPDGGLTITFENVRGRLFTGGEWELYEGLPLVSLEATGRLNVRSNGDSRIQFYVSLHPVTDDALEVEFTPTEFAATGSFPVLVRSVGEVCSICQEEIREGAQAAETFCNHRFHLECLRQVRKKECPNCRTPLGIM